MPGWGIALLVILVVFIFAITAVAIVKSVSPRIEEPDDERLAAIEQAGKDAELEVNNKIQSMITKYLDGHGVVHRDVMFFNDLARIHFTQIDSLVVTKAGIFIIEIKGWKGEITSCDPKAETWTKVKQYHQTSETYGYEEKEERNPIKQINRQTKNFRRYWNRYSDYKADTIRMVVFTEAENIPEQTYNIKSALSCIRELSLNGNRDITKIEKIIAKILEKHGATDEERILISERSGRKLYTA